MKATFALAEKNNIPALLEMMDEFYAIDSYPFDVDKASRLIDEFIAAPTLGRLWLIFKDGKLVGYIVLAFGFSFEYGGRDAMIDEFYIQEPARGKGLGKETLEYVELHAKTLGINTLHLEVEKHNERAANVYIRKGFKSKGRELMSKKLA